MRWTVHSEKSLYTDPWLDIRIADVELPDGRHVDHRLIRTPPGAGAVVTDGNDNVLLLWRHRFITGSWGWEIPFGKTDEGEDGNRGKEDRVVRTDGVIAKSFFPAGEGIGPMSLKKLRGRIRWVDFFNWSVCHTFVTSRVGFLVSRSSSFVIADFIVLVSSTRRLALNRGNPIRCLANTVLGLYFHLTRC